MSKNSRVEVEHPSVDARELKLATPSRVSRLQSGKALEQRHAEHRRSGKPYGSVLREGREYTDK